MRLIDADALKESMKNAVVRYICTNTLYNTIMAVIDGSPTAERWIPCSERLPSKDGRYLVTYPLFVRKDKWVNVLWYGKPSMPNIKVKGKCWYRSDDEYGDVVYDDSEILAWMPLPKPYKGGGTE